MILDELQAVIPSFVARVERPDRGGQWIGYLETRARAGERWAGGSASTRPPRRPAGPSVTLLRVEGDEDDLLAALLFEAGAAPPRSTIREAVGTLDPTTRAELLGDLVGERANRRHRPDGASRRCATGSRSSPTTAPSATSSATGC